MKQILLYAGLLFLTSQSFGQCVATTLQIDAENMGELTKDEVESLKYLREEEFLAGDVYDYLSELYTLPVFKNIGRSEDLHTEKVRELLEAYGIEDPAKDHVAGIFKNKDLQKHYNDLIALGEESLSSAVVVGLTIEEMDIKDLSDALENVIKEDNIKAVYEFLLMGSHHHLKAFNFHAGRLGVIYSPQFLTEKEFKAALIKEN
ncbi:MAG: DUF2202 domain-containing protein [Bacteroidales bacterium]|nr:DUF2202 domain-containing protein [Bacteroidales bacterium]MCF8406201.1 DUF2202 domain-containing protein [Bacteroidales bacterium]